MELYHVLNRGVEKRNLFLDNADRARFVHDLWEFNDIENVDNVRYRVPELSRDLHVTGFVNTYIAQEGTVDLHGWTLMGNHYHLVLSEKTDGGLTKFIRRMNVGYANYFNERYHREGALFQGRSKKVLIERDAHFLHILHYIHLNPLDFLQSAKNWRSGSIGSAEKALKHLADYRWSSYLDYCGRHNFPSILTTDLFGDVFGSYEKAIRTFISDLENSSFTQYKLE